MSKNVMVLTRKSFGGAPNILLRKSALEGVIQNQITLFGNRATIVMLRTTQQFRTESKTTKSTVEVIASASTATGNKLEVTSALPNIRSLKRAVEKEVSPCPHCVLKHLKISTSPTTLN